MALPITIFKNILDFKCMHIEKAEKETRTIQAYGELWDQDIVVISARPFKFLRPSQAYPLPRFQPPLLRTRRASVYR